jgi:UrcA family protein
MRGSLNMSLQIASRSRLPIEISVFAAACLPAAGDAEAVSEEPSTKMKFGDPDINTDAGTRELLTRLKKGADRVCLEQALTLAGTPTTIPRAAAPPLRPAVDKVHHE